MRDFWEGHEDSGDSHKGHLDAQLEWLGATLWIMFSLIILFRRDLEHQTISKRSNQSVSSAESRRGNHLFCAELASPPLSYETEAPLSPGCGQASITMYTAWGAQFQPWSSVCGVFL